MTISIDGCVAWVRKRTGITIGWLRNPANIPHILLLVFIGVAYGVVIFQFDIIVLLTPYLSYFTLANTFITFLLGFISYIVAAHKWAREPEKETRERKLEETVKAIWNKLGSEQSEQFDTARPPPQNQHPASSSHTDSRSRKRTSSWLFIAIVTLLCCPLVALVGIGWYFPVQKPTAKELPQIGQKAPEPPTPSPCTTPEGLEKAIDGGIGNLESFITGCQSVPYNLVGKAQVELDKRYRARLSEIPLRCTSSTTQNECSLIEKCFRDTAQTFRIPFDRYDREISDLITNEKKSTECATPPKTLDPPRPQPFANPNKMVKDKTIKDKELKDKDSKDKEFRDQLKQLSTILFAETVPHLVTGGDGIQYFFMVTTYWPPTCDLQEQVKGQSDHFVFNEPAVSPHIFKLGSKNITVKLMESHGGCRFNFSLDQ